MRVLIAEDERQLADTLAHGLRHLGIAVDVCYDGDAALESATVHDYDVVVLDRDLPKVHGIKCAAPSWPAAATPACSC